MDLNAEWEALEASLLAGGDPNDIFEKARELRRRSPSSVQTLPAALRVIILISPIIQVCTERFNGFRKHRRGGTLVVTNGTDGIAKKREGGVWTYDSTVGVARAGEPCPYAIAAAFDTLPITSPEEMKAPMTTNGKYPEHDKLEKVKDRSQACGEFMEWLLGPQRYQLGEYHVHTRECYVHDHPEDEDCFKERNCLTCTTSTDFLFPAPLRTTKLLAEFFEIDEEKLEAEKVAMLEELRSG